MENISIITVTNSDGSQTEHILIDKGNNEFFTQPKSVYDAQQAQAAQGVINGNN